MVESRGPIQTTFGGPEAPPPERGNCWACCVATMLNIPVECVPRVLQEGDDMEVVWEEYRRYLAGWGFRPVILNFEALTEEQRALWWEHIGSDTMTHIVGTSPRGNWRHGVVYLGRELYHDPHPSGEGVLKVLEVELWVPLDPAVTPNTRRRDMRGEATVQATFVGGAKELIKGRDWRHAFRKASERRAIKVVDGTGHIWKLKKGCSKHNPVYESSGLMEMDKVAEIFGRPSPLVPKPKPKPVRRNVTKAAKPRKLKPIRKV